MSDLARQLWEARRDGRVLARDGLVAPVDAVEAYAVQAEAVCFGMNSFVHDGSSRICRTILTVCAACDQCQAVPIGQSKQGS